MNKYTMEYTYFIQKIDSITEKNNSIKIERIKNGYKININNSTMYLSDKYYEILNIPI